MRRERLDIRVLDTVHDELSGLVNNPEDWGSDETRKRAYERAVILLNTVENMIRDEAGPYARKDLGLGQSTHAKLQQANRFAHMLGPEMKAIQLSGRPVIDNPQA